MTTQTITNFNLNPNSHYLFGRTYSLEIGAPNQTTAIRFSNYQTTVNSQPIPSAAFRIGFEIDKNLFGVSPNKGKIDIWNLGSQNRSKIKAGYIIKLQAGYKGLMDTIFIGNISTRGGIKSERHGADIVTSFEAGEGESVIVMATLDKSYPPGTSNITIITDIAKALSVTDVVTDEGVSLIGDNFSIIPMVTYGRGFAAHGACKDILDKLLINSGFRWTVQNGTLVLCPVTSTTNNINNAIVVSSGITLDPNSGISKFDPKKATGLIGVPSLGQDFVCFKSLLNPNIKPGALVQLICEDQTLNGYYKLQRAKYVGDTHESKWHIECETDVIIGKLTGQVV